MLDKLSVAFLIPLSIYPVLRKLLQKEINENIIKEWA